MPRQPISAMAFSRVYPLYVQKAERKNRTRDEVDQIICWLTGYSTAGLQAQIEQESNFETFFELAPDLNPNRLQISGVVCGVRVETIEDPLTRNIRCMDKLIDELAKGKTLEKILRERASRFRLLPKRFAVSFTTHARHRESAGISRTLVRPLKQNTSYESQS